jgi:cytochrome c oxidase cbb3-type subunit 3
MSESKKTDPIQGEILHEYDGILEADNQLPRWWLATFFGTVVFAAFYWFSYQAWDFAPTPVEEYALAMEAAAASGGEVSEELLTMVASNDDRVSEGRATFASNCAACHGQQGEGSIGPNLTDSAWIHGGAPTSIYHTVREGVGTAGMPAWGPVLGERSVQSVVAFVMSIRDTNVAGRPPQGDVYVPGAAPPEGAAPSGDAPAPAEGGAAAEPPAGAAAAPADPGPTEAAPSAAGGQPAAAGSLAPSTL